MYIDIHIPQMIYGISLKSNECLTFQTNTLHTREESNLRKKSF